MVIPVVVLAGYLVIGTVAAIVLTTPKRHPLAGTPVSFGLAYRDVRFPARGGDVQVAAWFIPSAGSHKAAVLVHGKDENRTAEFDGHFAEFGAALNRAGLSVLMIDLRGHGQSGDAHLSWGLSERRDIEGAADWLKSQGFRPSSIGVLGVSLGAASSIFATADDPDIGALVEDSGYATIYTVIQKEWRRSSGLPNFFLPVTALMGRLLFGYDLGTIRPVDEIRRIAPRPVLIIHGLVDGLIPVDHARELKTAYPSAEVWEVEGADHAGAYMNDPQAYVTRVAGFFEKNLK